jgi:cell division protein FtsQ
MMKELKYPLLLLLALTAAALLYGFSAKRASKRVITLPEVKFVDYANPMISEKTVLELISNGEVDTLGIEEFDIHTIEQKIANHPLVKDAQVSVDLLGNSLIEIEQKKATARIMDAVQGYLDTSYELMPLSKEHTSRVPLVHGYDDKYHESLVNFLRFVEGDSYLANEVTQVLMEEKNLKLRVRSWDFSINVGKAENLNEKFMNYRALLAGLQEMELIQIKTVDLRFNGQVVTTNR